MRLILFTGKGGVGKTTTAAATALKTAMLGYKTLVISTDPAHSLSDAFDTELAPEPTLIAPNLYGQEIDVYYSMRKYWSNMRQLMKSVLRWQGLDNVLAEELSAIPGMEEASAFLWIEKYYSEKAYDVIIIDSAPTGETLTFLSLPQITSWWMKKGFPMQKLAIKSVGKVVRNTTGVPLDKGYEELEYMFGKLELIQKIFVDPAICSVRIVANPERMVIQEAKRAYTYLQLYGYNVDAVVVNRILPEMEKASFLFDYVQTQNQYINEIKESFAPIPILKVGHLGKEVFGIDKLTLIAHKMYGNDDPTQVYHQEKSFNITEYEEGFLVQLKLPFLSEGNILVKKFGEELVIEIGNRRRNLFLPKFANYLELGAYDYANEWLRIELLNSNA